MMASRHVSMLLLVVLGTFASAVGCDGSTDSEPPAPGGGGAPQTGVGGSGNGNDAASGSGNNGGAQTAAGGSGSGNDAASGSGNNGGAGSTIDGAGGAKAGAGGSGGTVSSGGARSDGGSIDAGGSACQQAAAVDRTCTAVTDCIVVNHQTDYIGQLRLLGIRSSEMAHFAGLETACHATIKTFHLPATTADDGSLVDASSKAVACQAGVCTTYSMACGQPCSSDHVCITCGTGANAKSFCSQVCSMSACTEAPRTSCLGGTSVNGGEGEFCFDPMFASGFMSSSCHR